MRRLVFLLAMGFLLRPVCSADVGMVYESERAVLDGKFTLAPHQQDGFVIPATLALQSGQTLMVGAPGQPLYRAALLRLDNAVNRAVIAPGELIAHDGVNAAHLKNGTAVSRFLPESAAPASSPATRPSISTEPFLLKINGVAVSSAPVRLSIKRNKSQFDLEVTRIGEKIWRCSIELTSEPTLSFWERGKERKNLADIPTKKFEYHHQAIFRQLEEGASFRVPVEVHFVKEGSYTWTIKVTSKSGSIEKTVPVIFSNAN